MIVDAGYVELLVAHRPVKPRNHEELAELTALLRNARRQRDPADAGDGAVCRDPHSANHAVRRRN